VVGGFGLLAGGVFDFEVGACVRIFLFLFLAMFFAFGLASVVVCLISP